MAQFKTIFHQERKLSFPEPEGHVNHMHIPHNSKRHVMIKHLPEYFTHNMFLQLASAHGSIVQWNMAYQPTGKTKGYGFIEYATSKDASHAISMLNGYKLSGSKYSISASLAKGSDTSKCDIYIYDLPLDMSHDNLMELFGSFGTIIEARIEKNNPRQLFAFGLVRYAHPNEAQSAVKNMDGQMLGVQGHQNGPWHPIRVRIVKNLSIGPNLNPWHQYDRAHSAMEMNQLSESSSESSSSEEDEDEPGSVMF